MKIPTNVQGSKRHVTKASKIVFWIVGIIIAISIFNGFLTASNGNSTSKQSKPAPAWIFKNNVLKGKKEKFKINSYKIMENSAGQLLVQIKYRYWNNTKKANFPSEELNNHITVTEYSKTKEQSDSFPLSFDGNEKNPDYAKLRAHKVENAVAYYPLTGNEFKTVKIKITGSNTNDKALYVKEMHVNKDN